jgi:hypothetical protein
MIVMAAKDLTQLSDRVRDAARIDANAETSWPLDLTAEAINELAASGCVLLGLDLRDYDDAGNFIEVAWSAYRGRASGRDEIETSRAEALAGIQRALVEASNWNDPWVLVTWKVAAPTH